VERVTKETRETVKVAAGEGNSGRRENVSGGGGGGGVGVLQYWGQVVGFGGFEGRALDKPLNRAVHRAVNRLSEAIQ
jgi:hypothetical protein